MTSFTHTLAAPVVHRVRRFKGQHQLSGVRARGPVSQSVVNGLYAATKRFVTPEEIGYLSRIEQRRTDLLPSMETVHLDDYGPGEGKAYTQGEQERYAAKLKLTRTVGEMTTKSKPEPWAYLLFRLIREVQPLSAIELGSCCGISAAYQAAAMKLNGRGHLVTMEGSADLVRVTARTIGYLELEEQASVVGGNFENTLAGTIEAQKPIDWAFIDGHHMEQATLEYAEQILRKCDPSGTVLVFDDIDWSTGMRRAWRRVVDDDRYTTTIDLGSVGIAVVEDKLRHQPTQHLTVSYG